LIGFPFKSYVNPFFYS